MRPFSLLIKCFVVSCSFFFVPVGGASTGVSEIAEASSLWRMFFSLSVVLVLIPVLLFAYKKLQSLQLGSSRSAIQIVSVQSLGSKEKLVMVEVENQRLLLGVTANSITKIKEFTDTASFNDLLEEENVHQNSVNESEHA